MADMPSTFEQLSQLKTAKPFEPFVIVTTEAENGHLVVVDRMHFATNGKKVTVIDHEDRSTRFDINTITRIRTIRSLLEQR